MLLIVRECHRLVIIRNNVFYGGGDGRMREVPVPVKVPAERQIRDPAYKF